MKKLYILFFLTIVFFGNAQIVNIPDVNLKTYLTTNGSFASSGTPVSNSDPQLYEITVPFYNYIDTNADDEIQVSEAQNVKYLQISNLNNLSSLEGLEAFTNLEALVLSNNSFINTTDINLSQFLQLKFLLIHNNSNLNNLDVSLNTNLIEIVSTGNYFTELDLSQNINLTYLNCSNNNLNNLDLSNNINLEKLRCSTNFLTSLDLSNNTLLTYLFCSSNQLTNLNISQNTELTRITCNNNQISNLNISHMHSLNYIDCAYNQLTSLISGNPLLSSIYCNNNQLTSIDVSLNPNLRYFRCSSNLLTNINLKNNNVLPWLTLTIGPNSNLQYICADESDINDIYTRLIGTVFNCEVNSYCSFTPNGTFYEISGNTKFDLNSNGCDFSDINYPHLNFSITNGTVTGSLIANQSGNYYIPVQAGNHIITPNLENPTYFNISPTSFTANFPTQASPFTQDFCVTPNGVKSDVEVVLIPTTPARPGFDATYKLVYRNKGNQVENGTISLTFDETRLDYVTANPVYDSSATNSFTWNYVNLQPFETREIGIIFNLNSPMEAPAVNNGDILNYTATISTANTDETPTDNTFTLDQTVVGSYDPNDKTCLQGETIAPTEVGKYVHYVIRFENTGTYPAENVVVKDMIDLTKFDIATLVPLKSSHDFFTRISGNKVEFIFENINLDFNDATNDGYVMFKIKTKPTLVVGNTFTNNANIYFDYNFPITTNTYTTTVAALSAQDFDFGTYFTLYPNPAKDVLNIQAKEGLAVNSVEIYNQLGQIVMAITNTVNSVDVANLASGTYFVKVNTEKGSANAKFVKE